MSIEYALEFTYRPVVEGDEPFVKVTGHTDDPAIVKLWRKNIYDDWPGPKARILARDVGEWRDHDQADRST